MTLLPLQRIGLAEAAEKTTCIRGTCRKEFIRQVFFIADGDQQRRMPAPHLCPECIRTDEEDAAARPAPSSSRSDRFLTDAGVDLRRHGHCTLENFDAKGNEGTLAAVQKFLEDVAAAGPHDRVRGLFLCGDTGTGKTHLAVAAMRVLCETKGFPANAMLFDRCAGFITKLQDTYGTGQTDPFLERRRRASLWVPDDFGAEKPTADSLRCLFDIFDAREGWPTVVTSNLTPEEIGERWDGIEVVRLVSRLGTQNFRIVALNGRDRRFD